MATTGLTELDYLLTLGTSGIKEYYDTDALSQRISEWLDHPVGSIADKPGWGSPLSQMRFEPANTSLAAAIEMAIVEKLPSDVSGLVIKAIRVEYSSIDEVNISIGYNGSELDKRVSLKVTR